MTTSQVLQHLYSLDTSSPDFLRCLHFLMWNDEEERYLISLQGSELARLVDFLDEVLDAIPITDESSRQCLHKLQALCDHHMTLPSSYNLSGGLTRVGNRPIAIGGIADVWEGIHDGRKVCIKYPRVSMKNRQTVTKSFFKEAVIWKRLRHPNVVPFIGVTINPLQLMSEYMPNGTLTEYVDKSPGANRIGLLLDVAEGLNYLHANYTIHGDLKGPNILVDQIGHARLTDFGFTSVVRGFDSVPPTEAKGYTVEWAAPEILNGANRVTREADVFAFGMVTMEVFTGRSPFSGFATPIIISMIMGGNRPARPRDAQELGLTDSVWDMTVRCWQQDPAHRPTMAGVVGLLRECYRQRAAKVPSSTSAPPRPVENIGDVANHAPTSLIPTDGKSLSTESSSTLQPPIRPSSRTHWILENLRSTFGVPHSGDSLDRYLARVGGISTQPGAQEFADVVARNLDSDEELDAELRSRALDNLRRICGRYGVVPTPYVLTGVVKDGLFPQKSGIVTETWRGTYETKPVAIKIFKITEGYKDYCKIKTRFFKEAVLWKRLTHKNILPFLGISRDVAEFCLISPWMKNGSIAEYVRNNSHVDPLELLKDTASGLNYLHTSGVVHGDIRAEHILVGDGGQACIANTGHTCVAPISLGAFKSNTASGTMSLGGLRWRWAAPELQRPDEYDMSKVATKPSDIYGMGMVVYEVLAREIPFREYADFGVLTEVYDERRPRKPDNAPSLGITESIWMLLEQCWDWEPHYRPDSTHVLNVLREACRSRDTRAAIPVRLKLKMKNIFINLEKKRNINPYIRLQYGSRVHTTWCATAVGGNRYVWNDHERWTITLDKQYHGQAIDVQLLHCGLFKRRELLGTGKLELGTNTMELFAEIDTQLAEGLAGAKVEVQVTAV